MTQRHWTLAVVCAATAMLMLDIAVVNTALSRIADDLDTGPQRPAVGRRRVHARARRDVVLTAGSLADRFGRRRLFTAGLALFTVASAACAASTGDRRARRRPRRPGRRRRDHVRRLAGDPRRRLPGREGARRRPGRLRRDDRRLVRHRPARRRRAHERPGLAVDLPHQRARSASPACGSPARTSWSRATRAPAGSTSPGQVALAVGLFLLVLALLRGNEEGWGSTPIVAALGGRRGRCWPRSSSSSAASRSRCCRSGCSATGTSPARRSRRSRSPASFFADLPLRRRSTCSRCSGCPPSRPASSTCPARS